jgi:hypothetical protein
MTGLPINTTLGLGLASMGSTAIPPGTGVSGGSQAAVSGCAEVDAGIDAGIKARSSRQTPGNRRYNRDFLIITR